MFGFGVRKTICRSQAQRLSPSRSKAFHMCCSTPVESCASADIVASIEADCSIETLVDNLPMEDSPAGIFRTDSQQLRRSSESEFESPSERQSPFQPRIVPVSRANFGLHRSVGIDKGLDQLCELVGFTSLSDVLERKKNDAGSVNYFMMTHSRIGSLRDGEWVVLAH
mmetsp:Transcript_22138/g.36669  ORF Transcript_22138/g.36669 Transcript_22138/m.36669 type:complete len:168 (+) Transcript_22138:167-670(+)